MTGHYKTLTVTAQRMQAHETALLAVLAQAGITHQGGSSYNIPITPDIVTLGPNPLWGTDRVGEPGERCEDSESGCTPASPVPSKSDGILTKLDLRVFDVVCVASLAAPFVLRAGFALDRGECCGYTFQLHAGNKTWSDSWAGDFPRQWSLPWAACICNDLPKKKKSRGEK